MLLDRLCCSVKYSNALNANSVSARSAPYHRVRRVRSDTPSLSIDSRPQSVTGAANCLDQTRPAAQLELVAQVLDAHVDQVRVAQIIEAPNILQDLLAREHLAWMTQEELE